ncbi:MAG: hypothetical protein ACI4RL_04965 [Ruminococcus sp.]
MKNQINVQHIKNYFSRKTVLILGIVLLVPVIASFIASIIAVNGSTGFIRDIYSILRATGELGDGAEALKFSESFFSAYGISVSVIQLIFSLIVPSVWIFIYFRSKSPDPNKTPSGGFMFFFVIYIISIVSASVILLGSIFLGVVGIILLAGTGSLTGTTYDETVVMSVVFIVLSVVFLLIGTFTLILSISGVKFFGATRKSMTSPNMIVSGKAYGVILAIISVFTVISGLTLIITGCVMPSIVDEFSSADIEMIIVNSLINRLVPSIILSGVATIISALPYTLESKIALGYCRMAKSVPQMPMPNQYNPYNQNNQYNQYRQIPPQQ